MQPSASWAVGLALDGLHIESPRPLQTPRSLILIAAFRTLPETARCYVRAVVWKIVYGLSGLI